MNDQIAVLEAKIKRLEKAKDAAENWRDRVLSLESFTPEQKIEIFNALHKQATEYMEELAGGGREPGAYWFYESVITKCLGPDVFGVINTILV